MAAPVLLESSLVQDLGAAAAATAVVLLLLRFWEVLAKRGVFEQVSSAILFTRSPRQIDEIF